MNSSCFAFLKTEVIDKLIMSEMIEDQFNAVCCSITHLHTHEPLWLLIMLLMSLLLLQKVKNVCCYKVCIYFFHLFFPQALPPTSLALSIYCTSVTVFFIFIKMVNYRLHLMFDEGEIAPRNSVSDISKGAEKKSDVSDICRPASLRYDTTVELFL